MTRSSLLLGFVACVGCSAPPSTSDAGSATDAGSPTDAGYVFRILDDGGVGIAVADGVDPFSLTLERVSRTDDAGSTTVLVLGPDGTTFTRPALVGVSVAFDPGTRDGDASITLPLWLLTSSDGGIEDVSSSTTLTYEPGAALTGVMTAVVPHFSAVGHIQGAEAKMKLSPGSTIDVGQTFGVDVVTARGVGAAGAMSGSIALSWTEGVAHEDWPTMVTFTDVVSARLPVLLRCRTAGPATLTAHLRYTAIDYHFDLLDFRRLSRGSDIHLQRRVFCHEPIPPAPPPPPPPPPPAPLKPPAPYEPPPTGDLAAIELGQAMTGQLIGDEVVTSSLSMPCGRGQGPCAMGVPYRGSFTLEVRYRNAYGGVLEVFFDTDTGIVPSSNTSPRLALYPMTPQSFDFVFTCRRPGLYRVFGGYSHVSENRDVSGRTIELGFVRCGGTGDAVMLSDNTRLTRNGASWVAQATGVTANVIAATDALGAKFGALDSHNVGYDTVASFESRLGLPRFELQSSQQRAVFVHNGTRYAQTGLVGAAAYGATDTLRVTGQLADGGTATFADGGAAVVTLAAPAPLPAPSQLFGPRAGLSTLVRLPDGSFDVLYVSLGARSPRGGEGGLFRTVPAAEMTLNNGVREAPLVDEAAQRALRAWGIDAGTVYVAAYRQQSVVGLFTESDGGARAVPVQAGRMVQVNVTDLAP